MYILTASQRKEKLQKELFGKAINIFYNDASHHPAHNSSPVYITRINPRGAHDTPGRWLTCFKMYHRVFNLSRLVEIIFNNEHMETTHFCFGRMFYFNY